MTNKMVRTAAALASAGAVAAGTIALAAPAEAAPGQMSIRTYAKCVINHDVPKTDHVVWPTNNSNRTITNVRIGKLGGFEVSPPRMAPQQEFQRGAVHYYSATGVRRAGQLGPRESIKVWTLAPGCNRNVPIVGYTTGSDGFNIG